MAESTEDKSGSQQGPTVWGYSKKQNLAPVLTGAGVTTPCYSPPEALTGDPKPRKPAAEEGVRGMVGYSTSPAEGDTEKRSLPVI